MVWLFRYAAPAEVRLLGRCKIPGPVGLEVPMPAKSERQRRFMGAELGRKRAGKKTKTGMTEAQLEDFARKRKRKEKRRR